MVFSRLFLEHEKVATVPGVEFGNDGHVRLSYATSMAHVEAAMDRMERFLSEFA
jgi:aspartate aminotransferase